MEAQCFRFTTVKFRKLLSGSWPPSRFSGGLSDPLNRQVKNVKQARKDRATFPVQLVGRFILDGIVASPLN